jgi:GNAT superfamily N-acetyltransferase
MDPGWQSLRAVWQYQGPWRAILRAGRKLLAPLLDCDVLYVYERDLSDNPTEYPVPEGIAISSFNGEPDLLQAQSVIGSLCQHVEPRLRRGDVAVVAYAGDQVAGYTWMSFSNTWVEELEMTVIVRKGEMVHYDSFVNPGWRGQGLHTCLIVAAKHRARLGGCFRALSWISTFNAQSLKTAQRLSKANDVPMIVLSIKTAGMRTRWNFGVRGSISGRFLDTGPPPRSG